MGVKNIVARLDKLNGTVGRHEQRIGEMQLELADAARRECPEDADRAHPGLSDEGQDDGSGIVHHQPGGQGEGRRSLDVQALAGDMGGGRGRRVPGLDSRRSETSRGAAWIN